MQLQSLGSSVWSLQTLPSLQVPTQASLAKPQQFLQVQFLMYWSATGSGICELITVVSGCHICANSQRLSC